MKFIRLTWIITAIAIISSVGLAQGSYKKPPKEIMDVLDAGDAIDIDLADAG